MNPRPNPLITLTICLLSILPGFLLAINVLFVLQTQGRLHEHLVELPHRKVALVLGTSSFLGTGSPSPYFAGRIQAAAALWFTGTVDYLLLSGDNQFDSYNEPVKMKSALEDAGVPSDRLVLDFAGFSTLDSVIRARRVFGQEELIVVSQDFQNQRAVFIGNFTGVRIEAYNARGTEVPGSLPMLLREFLARPKALLDLFVLATQPRFLGAAIDIQ